MTAYRYLLLVLALTACGHARQLPPPAEAST
jgi:hypothetical protein